MSFKYLVRQTESCVIDASSAVPAASPDVLCKKRRGRFAVGISPVDADVYIGGEDVTTATGMPIKVGDSIVIPVVSDKVEAVYVVGGQCIITEFFS